MATCNPATLLSQGMLCACSPNALRVAIISILINWLDSLDPSATVTTQAILTRAAVSGITTSLSPTQMRAVIIQLLCNMRDDCNLIPDAAEYLDDGGLPAYEIAVSLGTAYSITWGDNEVSASIGFSLYPSTGSGTTTITDPAAVNPVLTIIGTGVGLPVTAVVCEV